MSRSHVMVCIWTACRGLKSCVMSCTWCTRRCHCLPGLPAPTCSQTVCRCPRGKEHARQVIDRRRSRCRLQTLASPGAPARAAAALRAARARCPSLRGTPSRRSRLARRRARHHARRRPSRRMEIQMSQTTTRTQRHRGWMATLTMAVRDRHRLSTTRSLPSIVQTRRALRPLPPRPRRDELRQALRSAHVRGDMPFLPGLASGDTSFFGQGSGTSAEHGVVLE